jgi:hypothetical protein
MLTGYLKDNEIFIGTGCFYGPIEKFRTAVKEKHGGKKIEQDYLAALVYIESRLNIARESCANLVRGRKGETWEKC